MATITSKADTSKADTSKADTSKADTSKADTSVSIVLIETNGTVKTLKTKEMTTESLYKKCGFRVSDDFLCRHTWKIKGEVVGKGDKPVYISVWAKKTGKANFENKYDFPPPLDKELFFGTCAVIHGGLPCLPPEASGEQTKASGKQSQTQASTQAAPTKEGGGVWGAAAPHEDLTKEMWLKIYEHLFGGFEDIGEDEFSEDELANVAPELLTADGYLKDDFVVSDKELLESAEVSEEESLPIKKIKKVKKVVEKKVVEKKVVDKKVVEKKVIEKKVADKKVVEKKVVAKKSKEEEIEPDTSELEEEVYTFSDDD
jgi:hypothetical protein